MLTFDGVDVQGDRLAVEECYETFMLKENRLFIHNYNSHYSPVLQNSCLYVKSVIRSYPSVQKISFVGHSLGGLVARYAISQLFEQDLSQENSQTTGDCSTDHLGDSLPEGKLKGKIAGLEPMNSITLASPHIGSRWHRQIPLFHGSHVLEKVAARTSWFLGRTGKHLFLADGKDGKPPLLLRMVSDSEDLKFMSALLSFRRRVVYASANIVGWSTSSLRRRDELPKIKHLPRGDNYPHVVNVETGKTDTLDEVPMDAKINGTEKMNMEAGLLAQYPAILLMPAVMAVNRNAGVILHSIMEEHRRNLEAEAVMILQSRLKSGCDRTGV
ncbi:putative hydrolase [Hibiscus syriacus]|uniref:Hydrolase n=1 Tax=Hibiscus syriacus TaxID=106335 RepID=A0A6A2WET0_HIBSY|nr:putative hydrolase [Hibiscus syriacus]